MRKLIAVGVLVGGLLAMAGPAMAQNAPGIADPLTLAASGVLIPFFGDPGDVALLEVASPVGQNINLHMFFFDANCSRVGDSHFLPLTTNDIAFLQIVGDGSSGVLDPLGFFSGSSPTNGGLVAIASSNDGFSLSVLPNPIHSRMYLFNSSNGRSRIVEPIILDAAEAPGDPHTWSPLRTAATFFAPPEGGLIHTRLWLICPKSTVTTAPYLTNVLSGPPEAGGFPLIQPAFPSSFSDDAANGSLRAVVFDTDEQPLVDIHTTCDCVRTVSDILADISSVYGSPAAAFGTFTKIESNVSPASLTGDGGLPNHLFAFTGYKSNSAGTINDFFGRLSNGSYLAIDGTAPSGATPNER
jgi:hypothetical protein